MPRTTVGPLVRDWRLRRHRSQMDLALDVGVSTRHLSFVETGRARPSPELVLALADHLDVPLRERNVLLLAAGHAPRYEERSLEDSDMAAARSALQRLLDTHDPYPGVVVDRAWTVVLANRAAGLLTGGIAPELLGPPMNVFRVCLHPDGLAARTRNFPEWATYLLGQLRRASVLTGDPALARLLDEVSAYPDVAALGDWHGVDRDDAPSLLVPVRLDLDGVELSLFTTMTTFGTPQDITLDEVSVELFFPADDESEQLLRRAAPTAEARPRRPHPQ